MNSHSTWFMRLVLGVGALLLVGLIASVSPLISCPDCGGEYAKALARYNDPQQERSGELGCSRCGTKGKVSFVSTCLRRRLDSRLSLLVRASVHPRQDKDHAREALASLLKGQSPVSVRMSNGLAIRSPDFHSAHFVRDADELNSLVAVVLAPLQPGLAPAGVRDGGPVFVIVFDSAGSEVSRMKITHAVDEAVLSVDSVIGGGPACVARVALWISGESGKDGPALVSVSCAGTEAFLTLENGENEGKKSVVISLSDRQLVIR